LGSLVIFRPHSKRLPSSPVSGQVIRFAQRQRQAASRLYRVPHPPTLHNVEVTRPVVATYDVVFLIIGIANMNILDRAMRTLVAVLALSVLAACGEVIVNCCV
jgi:hypothetical protein